ncbi:MAG: HAD family phosphatase [Alistipes sp.]
MNDAQIRLLLLDFDGTLADTRQANARAYVATLREVGYALTEQEYTAHYFGMRCNEFLLHIGITDPAERERLRLRKIALYPTFFDTLRLNQSLWEFCQAFRAAGGRAWIVSTGSRANIDNAMQHLHLTQGIDGILSGADIAQSKPAPDCFTEVMRREGVTPQQTLIFEDSAIGIEAARRSGASYVVVKL